MYFDALSDVSLKYWTILFARTYVDRKVTGDLASEK